MIAPASSPTSTLLDFTLAFCNDCLNREDFTGASQALDRAVSLAPDNVDVLNHRGRLALFLHDPDQAQRDFAEVLRLDPRCASAFSGLARSHLLRGETSEAEAAAERALGLDPGDEEAGSVKAEIQAERSKTMWAQPASLDPHVLLAERDSARAERDAARAERDAARKTISGPFSTETASTTLQFDAQLPPEIDRAGKPLFHPAELLFPPHFFRPLNVRIDPTLVDAPRLNILLPSTSAAHNSGGPNTAYLLAAELAQAGIPLRIVAVNIPTDPDSTAIRAHIARISGVSTDVVDRIELVDGHNRKTAVVLGENDVFLATAWWTAQMVKYLVPRFRNSRFIYLIQDYEPNLHPISANSLLALETYDLDYWPVVNSRLLFDHFVAERVGRFADPAFVREGCWFEPAVDRKLYYPEARAADRVGKRRLLFYTRPDAPRNLLELGVAALMRLLDQGRLKPEEWEFYSTHTGIGGSCRPVRLTTDGAATLVPLALHALPTWAAEMRRTDVVLSLIWSPHTSYPVLEGAASGAMVVTNTCGVKTAERLRQISENIVAGAPTIEGIAAALATAAERAEDLAARVAGTQIGLPPTWAQSLGGIVPQLVEFLQTAGLTSAGASTRGACTS